MNLEFLKQEIAHLEKSIKAKDTLKQLLIKYNAWNAEPKIFKLEYLFNETEALREHSMHSVQNLRESIMKVGGFYSKE